LRPVVKVWWYREDPARPHLPGIALRTPEEVHTMQRILSSQLPSHIGEKVLVAGWIHRRRLLKSVAFLIVRDASGLAQTVISESLRALVEERSEESVVEVEGEAIASDVAPGGVEVVASVVRVLSPAQPPPFDLYRPHLSASLPTQLDHAAIALRHPLR